MLEIHGASGCGNNWAYGFNSIGPKNHNIFHEKIQNLLEKIDFLGGFFTIQGLAGGTGSGVGTYFSEFIKELFPSKILMNCLIWPYSRGEIIVQSMNTLLTIVHSSISSDGLIICDNDKASEICLNSLNIKNPTFDHMNSVISQDLRSVFLPVQ